MGEFGIVLFLGGISMVHIENTSLSFTILKRLVKQGIRRSTFPFDSNFTEEELDSIESLTMTSNDSFREISKLSNIKRLSIVGQALIDSDFDNSYEEIFQLANLENLSIRGVNNIDFVDLRRMSNLKRLILVNNYNLSKIDGLSQLKQLEEIVICGNSIRKLENSIDYIRNTSNARTNILDVLTFTETFPRDSKERKFLDSHIRSMYSNIKFGEMLEFNHECYTLEYTDMLDMSAKSRAIISRLKMQDDDCLTKVSKINSYIVKNVHYDYSGIDSRTVIYNSGEDLSEHKNEYFRKRALVINSSYSAIMNNSSVCDGYVNAMRLLLNIEGIESRKVLCSAKSADSYEPDHVIIKFRFDSDSDWLYADPEGEQRTGKNFFGVSYDEISKTHTIFDENTYASGNKVLKYVI